MVACAFLGFSSGMPYYVLAALIPFWMRNNDISLSTIGALSLLYLPFALKFLWAPFMDRFSPPFLGRRRGWALITQVALVILIAMLGLFEPEVSLVSIAVIMFMVSVFSASQDIVLDAYRRELLADDELGTGTSIWVNAWRVSGLVPGALSLALSDYVSWSIVFLVTSGFMLLGIVAILMVREVSDDKLAPKTMKDAVVKPFVEFFSRDGVRGGLTILAFLFFYKLGDNMATALATPFYLDMGFTGTEIASVAKVAGLWSSLAGGILGGVIMLKVNINRALWLFGFVQILTILPYVWLSQAGHSLVGLFVVVSGEYLGVGLGAIGLVAYMARETSRAFTATQFALFTSFMLLPRTFANATTGFIVDAVGWTQFYVICAFVAIPGMLLLFKVAPWRD